MVDIYVGFEERHFRIHRQLLCDRIPYFEKMFNGHFKEASEGIARFPEDDPAAFDSLIDMVVYNRTIRGLTTIKTRDGLTGLAWDPVSFYSLAEKLCLPDVMDLIMDEIVKYHKRTNELPSPEFAYQSYAKTSTGSQLQKYVMMALHYVMDELDETEEGWPTKSMQKLFRDFDNFAGHYIDFNRSYATGDPREASRCRFHVHGKGPCPSNGRRIKYTEIPGPAAKGVHAVVSDLKNEDKSGISE
jgi:hypothetical protein